MVDHDGFQTQLIYDPAAAMAVPLVVSAGGPVKAAPGKTARRAAHRRKASRLFRSVPRRTPSQLRPVEVEMLAGLAAVDFGSYAAL